MLMKQPISNIIQNTKYALCIGVFDPKLIMQASPYCGDQIFAKGLEANGYEVYRLDYRAFPDANTELKRLVDHWLISGRIPEIIWLGKCEKIAPEAIHFLKKSFPNAIIVKWAADVRNEPSVHDTKLLKAGVDWFFGTFGGEYLKKHLFSGMTGVGSIFTFTDSTFYSPQEVDSTYQSDVLWTGRRGFGDNLIRNQIIDSLTSITFSQVAEVRLDTTLKIRMFGHDGKRWLGNPDYVRYINGARIGIGSNSFNRTKYSSDRLGNYMSCGTFYLTQYIEGLEELFERGIELDWFETVEEMHEKIKYYLANETLRCQIAQNGRNKILKYFDYRPLVRNLLLTIETKKKQNSWEDVYIN